MQDLLELALDDPAQARIRANALLTDPRPAIRSYAHQAIGIILRDEGRPDEALVSLRRGLRAAVQAQDRDRERDVRATLATVLALQGRVRRGLGEFDRALEGARGESAAKVALRKAAVLSIVGRHREAAAVLSGAIEVFRSVGNPRWEARALVWLGHVELAVGQVGRADRSIRAALMLLTDLDARADAADAMGNLAQIAVARGDLASGARWWTEAIEARMEFGAPRWLEVAGLARTYLAAGMPESAARLLAGWMGRLPRLDDAELRVEMAEAMLEAGEWSQAAQESRSVRRQLVGHDRRHLALRAGVVHLRARFSLGQHSGLARVSAALGNDLDAARMDEAPVALTLAGRLATGEERGALWRQAASYRSHPNALVRAAAWLARALEREEAGDRGAALRACRAGLDAIDEQRRLLGSSELRAQTTTHGRELTEVALRNAAADPRRLLGWVERTRATTLAQPRMTSDAATIPESLAALRDNGRQLAEARAAGEPTEKLERERLRLERAVRAESHTVSAEGVDPDRPASAEEVVAGVGDGCLVELVDVDDMLHVLVVHDGRVRRRIAGPTADALALLDPVAMLLRRSARGRPAATDQIGARLQDAILGDAARLIPDGPLVLAPTTRLHGLPWAVLPALADRPFSVVPSAGQWLRVRAVSRPAQRRTVLVSGPGLESGGAEVPLLAQQHPAAQLLAGKQATLEEVLAGLDGADLVHLAAHGHFRADSPLFSSLDLADGPLTVHDIERIGRAPYRVVLSACESGVLAPVGAQELLGLAAALFGLGTAGLVCSVAEVNDAATADLMVELHAALAAGSEPAAALHQVRRRADDPVAAATAASFLALGV